MPYPALPPELPQVAAIAIASPADCAKPPNPVQGNRPADPTVGPQAKASAASVPPAAPPSRPEAFAPTFAKPAAPAAATPLPPAGEGRIAQPETIPSCAALLGNTTAAGYLSVSRDLPPASPVPQPTPAAIAPPTSPAAVPRLEAIGRTPTETAPAVLPKPVPKANPLTQHKSSLSYAVSGMAGELASLPQSTFMKSMDEAIVFEGFAETYQALKALTAADLARLAKTKSTRISQIDDRIPRFPFPPPNPLPSHPPPPPPPQELEVPGTDTTTPTGTQPQATSPANVIEVTADRQEYDERRQVFTAEGNVKMRFQGALLDGDRIQVNLVNRFAVAEGNVALTRGQQVLRGSRFEYNFVQGTGTVAKARGDIYLPAAGSDTTFATPGTTTDQSILARPLSDRVTSQQPLTNVTSPGGVAVSVGAGRDIRRVPGALPRGGEIRRLRFEAETIDFTPEGWEATNIDITNDPFSPPELVLRADRATLKRISPLQDEVIATRPRLVFDQKVAVPIFQRRLLIDRAEREPGYFRFGVDGEDRGGLFLEGILRVIQSPQVNLTIYPQIFLQRMFIGEESDSILDPDNFGVRARLGATLSPSTRLSANVSLTSFDTETIEDNLRASARIRQVIDTPIGPHNLAFEYSYRDRLFNGSLGFQTVQSSIGAILVSPNIVLGNSGLILNYQVGYQGVTADTDRLDLLDPIRDNNRATLGRFQTAAALTRSFLLWQGKPLPATRNEGLNYTPNPIVPYLSASATLRGVFSSYTNGDTQQDLLGTVSLQGQFGHFSRRFFDYTSFALSYTQIIGSGESPFFFDRTVDNRTLTFSMFQQLYGPLRIGFQTTLNVDTSEEISTDYFVEYSRRTHGIILRYNPVLEIGSISFRLSDFNWVGTGEPFDGAGVTPVEGGLRRN